MVPARTAASLDRSAMSRGVDPTGAPVSRPRHRREPVAVLLAVLAAMLVVGMVTASPVTAQTDDDAIGLTAQAAIVGQAQAAWAPITVTASPTIPIQGTLEVSVEGSNGITMIQREVEVSAGATKQWTVLVPPAESGPRIHLESGDVAATTMLPAFGASTSLVGVLDDAGFTDRVGAVTDPVTDQVWTTVDIDAELLDLGPLALETLGTLTAPADVVAGLDDDQRRALATAVNTQGLHLVVTDVVADPGVGTAPGTVDDGGIQVLPSAWPLAIDGDDVTSGPTSGAAAATTSSGRGRITWLTPAITDESLGAPRTWGQLWTATPLSTAFAYSRGPALDPWALQQSGVRLPSSWAMAAFAGGYLVVIGLVALFGVRRLRRRELAWVVLPTIALVLAAVAFAASGRNQGAPGRTLAQATWIDGEGIEELALVLPPELDDTITLPGSGWAVEGLTWDNPTTAIATADGVALGSSDQRQAFGLGVTLATRTATATAPLAIEAVVTPGGLRAEVTNVGSVSLTDLRLSADSDLQVDIGSLDPGAGVVVELADDGATVDGDDTPMTDALWDPIDNDQLGEEEIFMEPGMGGEFVPGPAGSFAATTNHRVATTPGLVWIRGLTTAPLVPSIAGPGAADPDVVMVGVRPSVDGDANASGSRLLWQPTTGNAHEIDFRSGMVFGAGTTWLSTTMPVPPGPGQVRIDVPRTEADDGCVDYEVYSDDFTVSRVEQLCDGEVPECPDEAASCEVWEQGMSVCEADGTCENWEVRFDGNLSVQVWDRDQAEFRPWDDDFKAAVDADPDLVVSPLGEVVVAITGTGEFPLSRIDVGTGGGP